MALSAVFDFWQSLLELVQLSRLHVASQECHKTLVKEPALLDVLHYLLGVALVDCLEEGNLSENLLVELVQLTGDFGVNTRNPSLLNYFELLHGFLLLLKFNVVISCLEVLFNVSV